MPEMSVGERVAQATWVSALIIVGIGLALWLFVRWEGQPSRWQRLSSSIMSLWMGPAGPAESVEKVVYRPVEATGMEAHTTPLAEGGMAPEGKADAPDMDALNGGMDWQPKLTRYPTQRELIVYLATIRHPGGKYQMSANQIVQATRGDRNTVLKLVKEVREGPPQYPPRTPEQQAVRTALGLDQ